MSALPNLLSAKENYSLLSIPFQYVLAVVPHAIAIATASGGQPVTKWDNSNPRAESLRTNLQKRLPAATYDLYLRAEAAHYNSLEYFPLYAATVLIGNFAKLPVEELNKFALGSAALRVLYQFIYIGVGGKGPITLSRSVVWWAVTGWALKVLIDAGKMAI